MGQIKDDFEHWLRNEKDNVPFYNGVVAIGISDLAEMVEEFLIWKAEEIRNTEDVRPKNKTIELTEEEYYRAMDIIRNYYV